MFSSQIHRGGDAGEHVRAQPVLRLHQVPGEDVRHVRLPHVQPHGEGPGDLAGMLLVMLVCINVALRPTSQKLILYMRVLREFLS